MAYPNKITLKLDSTANFVKPPYPKNGTYYAFFGYIQSFSVYIQRLLWNDKNQSIQLNEGINIEVRDNKDNKDNKEIIYLTYINSKDDNSKDDNATDKKYTYKLQFHIPDNKLVEFDLDNASKGNRKEIKVGPYKINISGDVKTNSSFSFQNLFGMGSIKSDTFSLSCVKP
jgi:hypothetical protein